MLACSMSVRENLELYGLPDLRRDGQTLAERSGATRHPNEAEAYILDGLPFYAPELRGDP